MGQRRKSKDRKLDREGRILLEFIEERGWSNYNGVVQGDEEGEFTFTGRRGSTVIHYIIGDSEVRDKIVRMTVGDRVDSDHHPVEVRLEGKVKGIWKGCKRRKCWRGALDEESRKEFRRKMGRLEIGGRELDEELKITEGKVKRAIKEIKRERNKGKKRRG